MNIKRLQLLWIGIAFVCVGYLILGKDGVVVGERQLQSDNSFEIGIWTPEMTFAQSFRGIQENLCRIDFWLDSYRPWDSPYLELRLFEIRTERVPYELSYDDISKNKREVRRARINGWLLSPHMFNSFRFEPLPDSKGKQYLLSIQSPDLKAGGSSIIRASSRKRLETEAFFLDGQQQERDLAFRIMYQQPRLKLLKETIHRLSLEKPHPFSSPAFYYLLFLVYLALILLLGGRLCRLIWEGKF